MDGWWVTLVNALSHGLLLFMLSAGLTLVLGLMGVLNVAHASFYMLGAYVGFSVSGWLGFGWALVLAPLVVGALGGVFEAGVLRRLRGQGHVPELLVTFGLSYVVLEGVQLLWGRSALAFAPPPWLDGPALTLVEHPQEGLRLLWGAAPRGLCGSPVEGAGVVRCAPLAATRVFIMAVALAMLALLALLARTRLGLVVTAAVTHAPMVQALGHDVPRVMSLVFGAGCAMAALAGVVGGSTFVTEPAMAASMGSLVFVVVVVGGLGSMVGAFWASLLVGGMQSLAVAWDVVLVEGGAVAQLLGVQQLRLAQVAPLLPYGLMVVVLWLRPQGLWGRQESAW